VSTEDLKKLADALIGDAEKDYVTDELDVFEALKPLLPEDQFKALGDMLEVCPIHFCDYRICLDDGLDCQSVSR